MITYNHARFIAQAIESALAQRASFEYEIVIGDDCSTDGTRDVVIDYARRHPDRIRTAFPPRNVGAHRNVAQTFRSCRGEYIAVLEGDDYWIDEFKIQLQADLLDASPDAFICGARAHILRDGDAEPYALAPPDPPEVLAAYGARELFEGAWWFRTCTKMFRRTVLAKVPPGLERDWTSLLWLIGHTNFGKVCFLDRVVGVYREHAAGAYSSKSAAHHAMSDACELLKVAPWFDGPDREYLRGLLRESIATFWADGGLSRFAFLWTVMSGALRASDGRRQWHDIVAAVRQGHAVRRRTADTSSGR